MLNEPTWKIATQPELCGNSCTINAGEPFLEIYCDDSYQRYRCLECATVTFKELWGEYKIPPDLKAEPLTSAEVKLASTKPTLTSFSYSKGAPADSYIIDVRKSVRNPWRNVELRKLNGLHEDVQSFISRCKGSKDVVKVALHKLKFGSYLKSGAFTKNIAIGCQGGKHRSVALVEMVAVQLAASESPFDITIIHRDLKVKEEEAHEEE